MDLDIKRESYDASSVNVEMPEIKGENKEEMPSALPKMLSYWSAVSRWALVAFAALAPIFFLPLTALPVAANKELLIFGLIIVAFFALLGRVLIEGKMRYPGHLIMISLLVLVLVWGAATFFSSNSLVSLIGGWAAPESFFTILLFAVLMLAVTMTFDKRDILISVLVFLVSLSVLGLLEILQLLKIFVLPFDFTKGNGFNPIGSVNDIGIILAFGLIVASALASIKNLAAQPKVSMWLKRLLGAAIVVFVLNLIIIDFWAIWVGLILAMIFMISFLVIGLSKSSASDYQGLQLAYFQKAWLPSIILLISLILLFIPSPLAKFIQTPTEVSPNFNSTINTALQNFSGFSGKSLLGSGPNTFSYTFNLHRPVGINQTMFWSTVFNTGNTAISSWAVTVGILGLLAILFLMVAFIWTGIAGTNLRSSSKDTMNIISQAMFIGVSFLFIMWFLYAVNFTVLAFAFWGMGMFLAVSFLLSKEQSSFAPQDGASKDKFLFKEIRIFTSPQKTFLFSLAIVGLMVVSIAGAYFEINRYTAEIYYSKADFVSAIKFWPYEDKYFRELSQSTFLQLKTLMARTDMTPEAARAEFQKITTDSIAAARQAQAVNPQNPLNSVLLGTIYENLIPFITDASNFASSAYSSAISLDPTNPSNYLALARVEIAKSEFDKAVVNLEKSVQLKNDYAPARFLLVQVYDRQGRLAEAVKRAEELVSLNINDVGALFQLGFLYYKNNQFDQSKEVFERAVQLSPNYSNARYFLGLIYDREDIGDKTRSLEQFAKIAELNPDNGEVKKIIANLMSKKPALTGIAPPAAAPQNRAEAPVK